jgi:hypothetical protein
MRGIIVLNISEGVGDDMAGEVWNRTLFIGTSRELVNHSFFVLAVRAFALACRESMIRIC